MCEALMLFAFITGLSIGIIIARTDMTFKIDTHVMGKGEMVEVYGQYGRLLACIYDTGKGIKVISKYVMWFDYDESEPPALEIKFEEE
jgi:hypothetical protein